MAAPTPAGTQRRIRALFARGWTDSSIQAATGVPADKLRPARLDRQSIRGDLDASVAGVYEALWNREPPRDTAEEQRAAGAARAYGRRWGWAPPMAWDDDLIDDPVYRPAARERTRTGERHVSALAVAGDAAYVREHGGYGHGTDSEWPCAWPSRRTAWRGRWSALSGTAAEQQRPEQNPNLKRARGARHDQYHDHDDRTSDRPQPRWLGGPQAGRPGRSRARGRGRTYGPGRADCRGIDRPVRLRRADLPAPRIRPPLTPAPRRPAEIRRRWAWTRSTWTSRATSPHSTGTPLRARVSHPTRPDVPRGPARRRQGA